MLIKSSCFTFVSRMRMMFAVVIMLRCADWNGRRSMQRHVPMEWDALGIRTPLQGCVILGSLQWHLGNHVFYCQPVLWALQGWEDCVVGRLEPLANYSQPLLIRSPPCGPTRREKVLNRVRIQQRSTASADRTIIISARADIIFLAWRNVMQARLLSKTRS